MSIRLVNHIPMRWRGKLPGGRRAFTLVELLTVIAIIGILAGIIVVSVGGVQERARKVRGRTEFQSIANALVEYRAEYKYWPPFLRDGRATDLSQGSNMTDLYRALTGREYSGDVTAQTRVQNRKGRTFYQFGDSLSLSETPPRYRDPGGNTKVFIAVDDNNDGVIETTQLQQVISDEINAKVAVWSIDETKGDKSVWTATFEVD